MLRTPLRSMDNECLMKQAIEVSRRTAPENQRLEFPSLAWRGPSRPNGGGSGRTAARRSPARLRSTCCSTPLRRRTDPARGAGTGSQPSPTMRMRMRREMRAYLRWRGWSGADRSRPELQQPRRRLRAAPRRCSPRPRSQRQERGSAAPARGAPVVPPNSCPSLPTAAVRIRNFS